MAKTYIYTARSRDGQSLSGTVLADTQQAAASYVRERGYFVTALKEKQASFSLRDIKIFSSKVKTKDLAVFCRQLSTMMNAGVPMERCLNILAEQTTKSSLKTAVQDVYKKIREGEALSVALKNHSEVFPTIMIHMVEAGEVGGVLDIVLVRLAAHFEKEHKLNQKVKSAMTYPAAVLTIALIVVTFILTFVFPTFMEMFKNMKTELPLLTRVLLAASAFIRENLLALALLVVGSAFLLVQFYQRPTARRFIDGAFFRIPVIGGLIQKVAVARFSRTLSTLIKGGVPILAALEVVKRTLGNLVMVEALDKAQSNVAEGMGLAYTLQESKVFTPMVVQMIAIGEESGATDEMLEKIADFYDDDVDDLVSRLSSLMEPALILFLGLTIGTIIAAVMLPLFDVMTSMNSL
ncbi:MAG: type II secretion system F family protein [Sporomusaceae bacterium]|nr:type II secretion system F family protein [Sporomusaceae bacterium]